MRTGFVAGINLNPVRAYVHKAGFEDAYHGDVNEARGYLMQVLKNNPVDTSDFDYVLAAIWADQGDRIIDFFGYGDIPSADNWPGNPDVSDWNIINGLYSPRQEALASGLIRVDPRTCGDTTIILGAEEIHRRRSRNLNNFLMSPPRQFRRLFRD